MSILREIQSSIPEAAISMDAHIDAELLAYFEANAVIDRAELATLIRKRIESKFVVLPIIESTANQQYKPKV
jgi:hypothetical protein